MQENEHGILLTMFAQKGLLKAVSPMEGHDKSTKKTKKIDGFGQIKHTQISAELLGLRKYADIFFDRSASERRNSVCLSLMHTNDE